MKGKRMRRDDKGTQLMQVLNKLVENFNDPIMQREAAGVEYKTCRSSTGAATCISGHKSCTKARCNIR